MSDAFAHVAIDLPLEGPFDYLIPEPFMGRVGLGMRVMVSFAGRVTCGIVVGLAQDSTIKNLKPITQLCENNPSITPWMVALAKRISCYYGCSMGQAFSLMLPQLLRRGKKIELTPSVSNKNIAQGSHALFFAPDGGYLEQLKQNVRDQLGRGASVLILVPDAFVGAPLAAFLKEHFKNKVLVYNASTPKKETERWLEIRKAKNMIVLGTRSALFAPIADLGVAMIVEEANTSFKEEQTPMYETRELLLWRAKEQGFDVQFFSVAPSPEIWFMAKARRMTLVNISSSTGVKPQVVDLTNYKFIPGMVSIPVKNAIDAALAKKSPSILVLNRRGGYSITRCVDCGLVLKCTHCDSALMYSRSLKKFLCRHCTFNLEGESPCPSCQKMHWKSMGMGVEQLQSELLKYFPTAVIASFERESQLPSTFDILITTQAVLRFRDKIKAHVVALIDFDAELNRMDMRSSFKAWSLAQHLRLMATGTFFVQSRNPSHYVIKHLIRQDHQGFYDEEMGLRERFEFSPYMHTVAVAVRAKEKNKAYKTTRELYDALTQTSLVLFPPREDSFEKQRDQFKFTLSIKTKEVEDTVALIKKALTQIKRRSVIVSFNIDP